jgi:hypothetical protein
LGIANEDGLSPIDHIPTGTGTRSWLETIEVTDDFRRNTGSAENMQQAIRIEKHDRCHRAGYGLLEQPTRMVDPFFGCCRSGGRIEQGSLELQHLLQLTWRDLVAVY